MLELSGIELIEAYLAGLPVILTILITLSADITSAISKRARHFISKPLTPKKIPTHA